MMKYFAGIEGGASSSKLAILSSNGHVIYEDSSGPPTNHWLIGIEEVVRRIKEMIDKSGQESSLETLTVCLSGCEDISTNEKMRKALKPLANTVFVESDTKAPLFACGYQKGIVLIAGTGSNCLLFGDNSEVTCGGWGHVLGDEGSAFWISKKAIKAIIDSRDHYKQVDCLRVQRLVEEFFQLKEFSQILNKIYGNFQKSEIASLCLALVQVAEEGDPLAKDIFNSAGKHLGRHVRAVLRDYSESSVVVVCVGSLFKSWSLLSSGFFSVFNGMEIEITLKRLKSCSAIGSALIGAHMSGHSLSIESESEVLAQFKAGKWF